MKTKELDKQVQENTNAISDIQTDIKIIKDNHLHHIEKDMEKQSKLIEKMDMRIWSILILLVASFIIGVVQNGL
jgi:hypothetical protein